MTLLIPRSESENIYLQREKTYKEIISLIGEFLKPFEYGEYWSYITFGPISYRNPDEFLVYFCSLPKSLENITLRFNMIEGCYIERDDFDIELGMVERVKNYERLLKDIGEQINQLTAMKRFYIKKLDERAKVLYDEAKAKRH